MKKHGDSLFQIGEITKIMGVTRKTLLVFEDMGLLTPAVKDEESGFRYYSADNMTQTYIFLCAISGVVPSCPEYLHCFFLV